MSNPVLDYIEKNREHFLEGLKELLRVESVSTQPQKKPDILKCADLEIKKFREIGLENVGLLETTGYPLVYGDWLHAPGKPTIVIYGHYDVQPPEPLELWKTPPFEPTVQGENLYARGADDNKGQHFSHLCALEAYFKTVGKLPLNVKVVLEGEEESSSEGIMDYIPKHKDFFSCDAVLVSDTAWFDFERPAICYSLRGLCYFEITVKGPSHDLHSGIYGGMIRNPLQALSWILGRLKDENERVLIPGFYDDVKEPTAAERKELAQLPFDEKACREAVGVSELFSEKNFSPLEANWIRPTLDICGVSGGYEGPGAKTVIASQAKAKVSTRLVANQNPKKIVGLFTDYVRAITPKGVQVTVEVLSEAPPVYVDRDNVYLKKVALAYEKGFGRKVILKGDGASIPVVATFQQNLKVPVVLIGLGLPDDRLHSPNEKISLKNFYDGIKGAALAYQALSEKS